jgi:hypothetical protein
MVIIMIITVLYTNKYIILITIYISPKKLSFGEKSLIIYDLSPTCFGSFGPLSGRNK